MRFYAKAVALGAGLLVLSACGTGAFGGGRPCTMMAARAGVSLDVRPPDAAGADRAEMRICWDGTCRDQKITLRPTSRSVPMGCEGDGPDAACGASSSPDGGKRGFAEVENLPQAPVQITVVLRDAGGGRILDKKVEASPRATYPNGKGCDPSAPQAGLTVSGGKVAVRS